MSSTSTDWLMFELATRNVLSSSIKKYNAIILTHRKEQSRAPEIVSLSNFSAETQIMLRDSSRSSVCDNAITIQVSLMVKSNFLTLRSPWASFSTVLNVHEISSLVNTTIWWDVGEKKSCGYTSFLSESDKRVVNSTTASWYLSSSG